MKITTIEFSHGPVSIYAHSFESENITMHVKEFLSTFKPFQFIAHELSPGIGRVTICSTDSIVIPFESLDKIGTLHLHFSNGKTAIDQDVILSTLRNPEKRIAANRIINEIRSLIQLNEPEFVSA
ncbi:hypothetical protein [Leptospira borgpetersenii]|uniref:hypothetical protein n=1 Tax=Leptospira borgpetersenii TaxID=174 RepID=UPI000774CDEC|nr:hypothetical protein [Leptospira borgpetersenii]MBE8400296.1 hypothetical protein [Leptospira borgpetersenii serovar Tarassovi]MBE8403385.1 hypothetical protein [Leptospira borgpetersenii serovar Tarassovi]MBE8406528.1 hypothetical protein [Leptospira borgpetersenii serovar Tarassovi]MBE8412697.1 hypothetical protein [Leptospira borgpetersenii serovar Tarassovi]MBE8415874.1 hypothetical protein [Leptospira borgpetersenii serovar Tarassovi]